MRGAKRLKKVSVAFALIFAAADAASAAPLPTRDQNPLLAGFGLPTPMPASLSNETAWSLATDFNWGSTALVQAHGAEALIVDAETQEVRVTIRRTLTNRFAFQLQIPWRYIGAGSLDGFINDWHDIFSLPEGARPILPIDQMLIAYSRNGAALMHRDASQSGVGDISLDFGYALHSTPSSSTSAWLSLELPTGDAAKLTGNEALDASVIVSTTRRFGDRWSVFGQASVSWLGEGDLLPERQRNIVWSGLAGLSWRAFQPLEFKVQLDAHTAAFNDSELDFLNESIALTVGGTMHFASGWRIDLAVSEDIAVETAADVVFVIGLRKEAASH
ncbi:MAG: DUF3187 family protein [Steroidobacter sp.]